MDAAKKLRRVALSNFTRNLNALTKLMDEAAPRILTTPQFDKLQGCLAKLEECHDNFLLVTEIDIEEDNNGIKYIDAPNELYQAIVGRYSTYLKTLDELEQATDRQKADNDSQSKEDVRKRTEQESRDRETKDKFASAKSELESSIDAFKRMTIDVKGSLTTAQAGDGDKRREWSKI